MTERVSKLRERRHAEGLVRLEFWVHPLDVDTIKKEVAGRNAYRQRILKQLTKKASAHE